MSNDNSAIPRIAADLSASRYLPHRSNALAIAEGLLLLGGLAALDYFGILPFSIWPVHPFMFVVILLAAQYGVPGGVLAALAAIAISHFDGWPVRPIDMTHAEYFQATWALPMSWVLAALMVGLITSQRNRVLKEQAAKLHKAAIAESLIAAQYQVLAQRTHDLERSLAGRSDPSRPASKSEASVEQDGKSLAPRAAARARKSSRIGAWSLDGHA